MLRREGSSAGEAGIVLPPGLLQPLLLRFRREDLHIMAFFSGHPDYEAVEAMIRYRGDQDAADRVYDGVADPLTADDVADCIAFVVTRPAHVNIDLMVVKPIAQAAPHKVDRRPSPRR